MMHHACLIPGCYRRATGSRTKQFCAHHMARLTFEERLAIAACWRRLQLGLPRRYPMQERGQLALGGTR